MFMSGIYVMQMQKIKSNLYISLTFRKLTYLQRPVKLFYQTNQRDPYEPHEHLTLGSLYITDIWNPSQDDETPPVPPTLPLPPPLLMVTLYNAATGTHGQQDHGWFHFML